jgi:hypothetical protein
MKKIRRISSSLKPALKEANMKARVQFCLDMIDGRTTRDEKPTFTIMHNIVHIDEKRFTLTKKQKKHYLLPEEEPHWCIQNKNSIGKVMYWRDSGA